MGKTGLAIGATAAGVLVAAQIAGQLVRSADAPRATIARGDRYHSLNTIARVPGLDLVQIEHDGTRLRGALMLAGTAVGGGGLAVGAHVRGGTIAKISAGVFLGGMLSNSLEQLMRGSVTDYLFYDGQSTIWNAADMALMVAGPIALASIALRR